MNDAELANLIRNAVAQGPIPADRARNALPTMLARISEENTARTIELLDMFYPAAAAETEARAGRGHERRLRGAGTAPGRMSGEAPRPQPRAPAPARDQVKLPEWGR